MRSVFVPKRARRRLQTQQSSTPRQQLPWPDERRKERKRFQKHLRDRPCHLLLGDGRVPTPCRSGHSSCVSGSTMDHVNGGCYHGIAKKHLDHILTLWVALSQILPRWRNTSLGVANNTGDAILGHFSYRHSFCFHVQNFEHEFAQYLLHFKFCRNSSPIVSCTIHWPAVEVSTQCILNSHPAKLQFLSRIIPLV